MRPSNLPEVASSVVKGMSRSINRSAQPTEDQTHEESREGSAIQSLSGSERQQLYNLIDQRLKSEGKEWDYVYTVTGKDYEDSAYSAFADMPENSDWVRELIMEISRDRNGCSDCEDRKGSRKGDSREEVIDEVFDGDEILYNEYLDEMGEYGLANWSIDTWKEYLEKYEMGLDPEGEDKFLEAHRNG